MRSFRALALLAVSGLLAPELLAGSNVLLIIADDLGADSFPPTAQAGASLPPMPNVTALLQRGVLFRRASGHPTCSPTRASILTGRHPFRTGIGVAIDTATSPQLSAGEFTLPDAFAASPALGYTIASFGKWHLASGPGSANSPATLGGWTTYAGLLTGALPDYSNWTKTTNGSQATSLTYATTDTANDAVAWIQARGSSPWFLWLAFCAPHTPFHKPPNDLHSYDALSSTVTGNRRPYFEAACEALDTEIGRVLATVDLNQTTVIFLGDNGTPAQVIQPPYSAAHAKGQIYEGGTRIPLLIAGAGVSSPNRESTAPVDVADLYATILELAGANVGVVQPAANPLDSRSLLPILQNAADPATRYAFSEQFGDAVPLADSGQALRDSHGMKLLQFRDGREEFYDLNTDPDEQSQLSIATLTGTALARYHTLKLKFSAYQQTLSIPLTQSVTTAAGGVSVRIGKVSGSIAYTLYASSSLVAADAWLPVANASVTDEGTTMVLVDPTPGTGEKFYRVLAR